VHRGGAQCNRIIDFNRLRASALRKAATAALRCGDVRSGNTSQSASSASSTAFLLGSSQTSRTFEEVSDFMREPRVPCAVFGRVKKCYSSSVDE
jgi:hypothetical protein